METRLTLAMQLLTGDGMALDPVQAAGLLTAAAEQGDAQAAALMATVEAMGVAGPQSWDRAMDWLRRAAALGSESAQAQLRLLSRGSDAIDIGALITPPPKRSLSDAPRIRVIEGFATPAECDWVMARARGRLSPAVVIDPHTGLDIAHPDRTNNAIQLNVIAMDVVIQVLRARIGTATNLPVPVFEPAQIMHYSIGEEFRPHYDFLTEDAEGWAAQLREYGQRIATFLLYLNDDFEGAETDFPSVDISHRGAKGDALFFANVDPSGAPDRTTLHAGRPPTRGEKWILSQWIRDRTPTRLVEAD